MSKISNLNSNGTSTPFSADTEQLSPSMEAVFQRIQPREVEQFYKSYHFWLLQRRIETFYTEARAIQQALIDNNTLMQQVHLSAIALASLAQLQASGVSDLNLLDRMLERGETWLDHTMQLLEHCEKLDVIQGDYTQWCEHALEGAYDWIASMEATEAINQLENDTLRNEQKLPPHTATEEQLLQKLMSDEGATEKIASLNSLLSDATERTPKAPARKITQPLDQTEPTNLEAPTRKITQPLDQSATATSEVPLPMRKITQPLDQGEVLLETVEIEEPHIERSAQIDTIQQATEGLQEKTPQEVAPIEAEDAFKEADIHPLEEAIVHKEALVQTRTEVVTINESSQGNKKPQLQKVQRRGFWRLLHRLLTIILRR
jgi:hypothetical protein